MSDAADKARFNFFMPIMKVKKEDDGSRTVTGYASTPRLDMDGEIVSLDAVKKALPGYMEWRNIRQMHHSIAVGTAKEAHVDDTGLFIKARIVEPGCIKLIDEEVLKGFSIGGRKLDKVGDTITEIEMVEISVVDRPANPDCRFSIAKSAKSVKEEPGYLLKVKKDRDPKDKALRQMAKAVELLSKAGPPAARDGFSLPAKPGTNASPKDPDTQNNKASDVDKGGDKPGEGKLPYGDVEYADPGYQADKQKRYPIDTEGHIRAAWNYIHKPKNAGKYTPEQVSSIKSKITAAWKSKIDKDGPPAAQSKKEKKAAKKLAKKLRKAKAAEALAAMELSPRRQQEPLLPFLDLDMPKDEPEAEPEFDFDSAVESQPSVEIDPDNGLAKSMSVAGDLACCFDTIRRAQRSLLLEAQREGGDMKDKSLAKRLGAVAKELAAVIGQKAEHEGGEALDLSDADDSFLNSILGEDFTMSENVDDLTKAIVNMVKRSAEPTRAQRIAKAAENLRMARKARKAARSAIEDAHKMHKAAYLSKAAKKGDKDDKNNDDFDHAGAMEKLQKAYGEIQKLGTFLKAAKGQLAKAAARSGQRGEEAGDAEGGFYEVPPGVKDLSPAALAGASPGGKGGAGQPPAYPGDGSVYPGKAVTAEALRKFTKGGVISADVAELVIENARLAGETEALRRLPAATGNRRPFAFDLTKVVGDGANNNAADDREKRAALFNGVDPEALASNDEETRKLATARVAGNLLLSGHFGKSILSPDFKGAAGGRQ